MVWHFTEDPLVAEHSNHSRELTGLAALPSSSLKKTLQVILRRLIYRLDGSGAVCVDNLDLVKSRAAPLCPCSFAP